MALREIVKFPDARLRETTQEVRVFDLALKELAADMAETMYANNGVGLAATQVGAFERLFLIEASAAGGNENDPPLAFVNPVIEELSPETAIHEEGCLSFPGVYLQVKRSVTVRVRALDLEGKPFVLEGSELLGRAIQHEYDHLIGRLLIDHAGPLKRRLIQRRLERQALENNYDDDTENED